RSCRPATSRSADPRPLPPSAGEGAPAALPRSSRSATMAVHIRRAHEAAAPWRNPMADFTPAVPAGGSPITKTAKGLSVPDRPITPSIEGDGTGPDIWRASVRVLDAAVEKAYGGKRRLEWMEVLAGEKAFNQTGEWLPESTVQACRDYLVSIKGPLTTPVGGGIRSLNVALRQMLDLYVCLRPVRWFEGVPSPVKK